MKNAYKIEESDKVFVISGNGVHIEINYEDDYERSEDITTEIFDMLRHRFPVR